MCEWLPSKVETDGVFNDALKRLYGVFKNDFIDNKPKFGTYLVHVSLRAGDRGYEEVFWHLITKVEHSTGDRLLDTNRARRLPWCSAVINNSDDKNIKCWDEVKKKETVSYVWFEEKDFIVILKKVEKYNIAYLKTAYYIEGSGKRRSFKRKYEKSLQ